MSEKPKEEPQPIQFSVCFYVDRERLSDLSKHRLFYEREITVKNANPERVKRLEFFNGKVYITNRFDITQELTISIDRDSQFAHGVEISISKPKRISVERFKELRAKGCVVFSSENLNEECASYKILG